MKCKQKIIMKLQICGFWPTPNNRTVKKVGFDLRLVVKDQLQIQTVELNASSRIVMT